MATTWILIVGGVRKRLTYSTVHDVLTSIMSKEGRVDSSPRVRGEGLGFIQGRKGSWQFSQRREVESSPREGNSRGHSEGKVNGYLCKWWSRIISRARTLWIISRMNVGGYLRGLNSHYIQIWLCIIFAKQKTE